jgi:hypothetical protein
LLEPREPRAIVCGPPEEYPGDVDGDAQRQSYGFCELEGADQIGRLPLVDKFASPNP